MDGDDCRTVWQERSWRLCVDRRTLRNGTEIEAAYIDHPGAVVIVPLREHVPNAQVLMLRQYRHALRKAILELPAGTRQDRETWEACAHRELREETGYAAGALHHLGDCWPAPGVSNEVMAAYLATELRYDPLPQDMDEEIELVTYPFNELVVMALSGELVDAKSVVGILRAAFFRQALTAPDPLFRGS